MCRRIYVWHFLDEGHGFMWCLGLLLLLYLGDLDASFVLFLYLKSLKISMVYSWNEVEQTLQWPNETIRKDKQRSTKHTHKTKKSRPCESLKRGVLLFFFQNHCFKHQDQIQIVEYVLHDIRLTGKSKMENGQMDTGNVGDKTQTKYKIQHWQLKWWTTLQGPPHKQKGETGSPRIISGSSFLL